MSTAIATSFPLVLIKEQKQVYPGVQKKDAQIISELSIHIANCILNNRESQEKIYSLFYGYAMAICSRYTNNYDDSVEIINDGFLKVFKEIHRFKPAYADVESSFKGWLRKIMIYTSIDHFRRNQKHQLATGLDEGIIQLSTGGEDAVDKISYEEIIGSIQKLSPGYRTVFNLFVIEGFTHEEISKRLNITIGSSKSNLARARLQLQKILLPRYQTAVTS